MPKPVTSKKLVCTVWIYKVGFYLKGTSSFDYKSTWPFLKGMDMRKTVESGLMRNSDMEKLQGCYMNVI